MFCKKYFLIILLASVFNLSNCLCLFAQLSLSIGPGVASYSGDIAGPQLNYFRPAANLELWYQLNPFLYAKAGTSIYRIYAEDVIPERNRAFRANHYDAYTGIILAPPINKTIMPFLSVGIGITKVDPEHKVPLIGSDGYWWLNSTKWLPDGRPIPSPALIFPVGAGIKIQLTSKTSLLIDGALRLMTSDMLDGVGSSEIYVAAIDGVGRRYFETIRPNSIDENDILGNGNPKKGDTYGIISFKIHYAFGQFPSNNNTSNKSKITCPTYQ